MKLEHKKFYRNAENTMFLTRNMSNPITGNIFEDRLALHLYNPDTNAIISSTVSDIERNDLIELTRDEVVERAVNITEFEFNNKYEERDPYTLETALQDRDELFECPIKISQADGTSSVSGRIIGIGKQGFTVITSSYSLRTFEFALKNITNAKTKLPIGARRIKSSLAEVMKVV